MKRTMVLGMALALCIGCNDGEKASSETKTDNTATSKVTLPYTLREEPEWEWGTDENVLVAMNALKGYETADIDNTRQYFADSVEFRGDYWHYKGTADSLMGEFKKYRGNYKDFAVRMEDYESVMNKQDGDEYVSLWYVESYTDSKGKMDSIYAMDDLKIKNGKIISIDSKVRHYPTSSPK